MVIIKFFKTKIIGLLGGVSNTEHHRLQIEADRLRGIEDERNLYKDFALSTYSYAGSYPAWKAQSEYREMMHELGHPLNGINSDSKEYSGAKERAELIDSYLGRLVNSFSTLIQRTNGGFISYRVESWSKDTLPETRGDEYLKSK